MTEVDDRRLRQATDTFNDANDEFVAAVVELRANGASLAVIAEASGMSRAGVLKLLRRVEAP